MTPLVRPQPHGLPRWAKWLLLAVPTSGVLAGAARVAANVETRTHAESTYVKRDSFALHLSIEALVHQADSINYGVDKRRVLELLSGLDSSDRCRRGLRAFCR